MLDVPEGSTEEQVRKNFDNSLGVAGWASPGHAADEEAVQYDPDAPIWWTGDEDASQSFLLSQGVILPDG